MGKYEFIKTANIVPIRKVLELEYEDGYGGEIKKLKINVYPFTVEEKITYKNMEEEIKLLKDSEDEKNKKLSVSMSEDLSYQMCYDIIKKDDKEATLEIIKKFPINWISEIIFKALEFEGVSKEDIEKVTKDVKKDLNEP